MTRNTILVYVFDGFKTNAKPRIGIAFGPSITIKIQWFGTFRMNNALATQLHGSLSRSFVE
ncbi:hypothetical protein [Limnohabitans sp. Rim8]|jgi:hypothetical protein|uniref:hypothetical protein n=1 Tax=Limnohabitans sp. Rim8 TaxID=1100718 RepID=UPI0025D464F1|nr:hypothetical protein [Limnohabitans sp. Rim8]